MSGVTLSKSLGAECHCHRSPALSMAVCVLQDAGMERIPIPDEDVIELENIADGVIGLRLLLVNVFALSQPSGEWILIDCGLPHSQGRIRDWVEKRFGSGARPKYILLTHAHFDHAGSVEELAREWDVPVYVHPLEVPYVTGQKAYPPPDPTVGGGVMTLMCKLYPRDPVDLGSRVQTLPRDGSLPGFAGWRSLHTPGHTAGHVSLFREQDGVLLPADAFCTTKQESFLAVAMQRPELHGPPAYFTTDWDAARDSVQRLAALHPAVIAPGHGRALAGADVADALAELARNFDTVARPEHGRYVDRPAA